VQHLLLVAQDDHQLLLHGLGHGDDHDVDILALVGGLQRPSGRVALLIRQQLLPDPGLQLVDLRLQQLPATLELLEARQLGRQVGGQDGEVGGGAGVRRRDRGRRADWLVLRGQRLLSQLLSSPTKSVVRYPNVLPGIPARAERLCCRWHPVVIMELSAAL
jgi:hypothetical protein